MSVSTLVAPLVLASQSPRRQEILRLAELPYTLIVRPVDEVFPPTLPAFDVPEYISRLKAAPFDDLAPDYIVLTCDTVVILDNEVLGKPIDEADALKMLRRLCGQTHTVVSGVTLRYKSEWHSFSEATQVTFRPMSEAALQHYVSAHRPLDKAGAYGVQDFIGLRAVQRIEGDFYNVMGLPMCRLLQELESKGFVEG